MSAVHPRACGERVLPTARSTCRPGSSPRVRGTAPTYPPYLPTYGSSPRVRGTECPQFSFRGGNRFIPARAGNGVLSGVESSCIAVHPRACGERSVWPVIANSPTGSSPRVRGTAGPAGIDGDDGRFIPARAGNGHEWSALAIAVTVHPRACGERSKRLTRRHGDVGSSPRVRGTDDRPIRNLHHSRFIPARAGNGRSGDDLVSGETVHPRACGERRTTTIAPNDSSGSSPRVRGTVAGDGS